MRVASETIKRVCIQWVVKARCTMIPFRVCRSDGWRNRVSDRLVCHHLIRNRSKKKEILDCIFPHSHSNPLGGHRSSYTSSILIESIPSSGNDVTRYGIGAINVRFVASLAHACRRLRVPDSLRAFAYFVRISNVSVRCNSFLRSRGRTLITSRQFPG